MPRIKRISDEAILADVLRLVQRIGLERFTLAVAAAEVGLSASTLVQRFGSKRALLLAADRWAVERWVSGMDEAPPDEPVLDRLISGLVHSVRHETTTEEVSNSISLLQVALADGEFHESTMSGSVRLQSKIVERLHEAAANGELRPDTDIAAVAELLEITYHGAMIRWAIHRNGPLVAYLRASFSQLLQPYRVPPASIGR